jgi:hypothetical protein
MGGKRVPGMMPGMGPGIGNAPSAKLPKR